MLFNSFAFAVFLPIVFIIYWAIPNRFRWAFLLAASYYFYMSWNAKYIVLILGTSLVTYFAAIFIEKAQTKRSKKLILAVAAAACMGVLFFFKYFNFAMESVSAFCSLFAIKLSPVTLSVVLPVGISFYTFQTLSYVIDVYKGRIKAEYHFGIYAAFIAFFPQLVAGPIERSENLLPQITSEKTFDAEKAFGGLRQMAWGFFKKMVVADNIATYVDAVYSCPSAYTGFDLCLAVFFFTIQIYCDFSGYSDIAIGTAKLMGIDLMTNFKSPYFSASVKEFWSRWHISLSTWFRDYVYIPLGGNRCSKARNYLNLMITFLVSGLWHGANWTFVFWGGIHGAAQVLEKIFDRPISAIRQSKIGRLFCMLVVFLFCNIAWVFFRADNFSDAAYILTHMLNGISSPALFLHTNLGFEYHTFALMLVFILILAIGDALSLKKDLTERIAALPLVPRWILCALFVLFIMIFANTGETSFIYFQF